MWYVGYSRVHDWRTRDRRYIVYVSDDPSLVGGMKIRALTARAAARKYIRYNMPYAAARSYEYCDSCSPICEIPEREYQKILRTERKKMIAHTKIVRVRKKPDLVPEKTERFVVAPTPAEPKEEGSVMARMRAKHEH
jgi:hypothetical protein